MHVAVIHTITDAKLWDQNVQKIMGLIEKGQVPEGVNVQMYLPSVKGNKGVCLWNAGSVEALSGFLDREIGTAARNEYLPINDEAAMGLPGHAETQATA